ncbi:Arrestin domain-containing protein a, partial [Globisporangium splendens]
MGKQGKAFGLGKKGKIGIAVDKPAYIAGEIVRGTIYVDIYEPIKCDALVLKATGKEKVEWRETHTEFDDGNSINKYEDHEAEKEFFKQKIVISAISAMYMPGQYMYPFQYQLPVGLPGSFHLASYSSGHVDNLEAKIKYKFKATLDVDGFFASDLKADCNLVVHERNFQSIQPSEDSTTQSVDFLCCFNRGMCNLAVAMDKNVYLPGETSQIQCHIDNKSQVDITTMRCHLFQDIRLVGGHGHEQEFTHEIATREFPGVPAGSTLQQPQPLLLASDNGEFLNPSTTGTLVRCSYRIVVECDIPWCPDVELHLPVTIIAPEIPNLSWIPASTDGYVQQQVAYQ